MRDLKLRIYRGGAIDALSDREALDALAALLRSDGHRVTQHKDRVESVIYLGEGNEITILAERDM